MDENLMQFPDLHNVISRMDYYNTMVEAYAWHFRIKDRPATFDELTRFAQWQGLKEKHPTKSQLIDFFLENKICF
jgi:hypothetical protein